MDIWAPVLGSAIVATATLVVLWFTVRQSAEALATQKDHHRDQLAHDRARSLIEFRRFEAIAALAEIMTTAKEIIDGYT